MCEEGYKYNADLKTCNSVCSVPCSNGICTDLRPEVCICSSNYQANADGICIKNECDPATHKSNECLNGTCTANGVCLCDECFIKNDTNLTQMWSSLQIMWQRDLHSPKQMSL